MQWNDIKVKQYLNIKAIFESDEFEDDIEKGIALVDEMFNCNSKSLYISDFNNKMSMVNKLLSDRVPREKIKANYGKYQLVIAPETITTSQFIDVTTFQKNNDIVGVLSCLLIPKKSLYNDGSYSMDELREYIIDMPITEALGIMDFFTKTSLSYLIHSVRYLVRKVRGEEKKRLNKLLKELQTNLDTFLTSSAIVD